MGNCKPSRPAVSEKIAKNERTIKEEVKREVGELREEIVWERRSREFNDVYETVRQIGEGAFATVFVVQKRFDANRSVCRSHMKSSFVDCENCEDKRHLYAAKVLRIKEPKVKTKVRLAELRYEIDVLRTLDHPNILHLREVFWEETRLVLVMEFCQGCMLSSLRTKLSEASVALVAKQLLKAISYLHTKGVVHRDLKLDNIMVEGFSSCDRNGPNQETMLNNSSLVVDAQDESAICVKLIDFGLSRQARKAQEMGGPKIAAAGTLSTAAPEIVAGDNYEFPADIWSIGACIYKLIGGLDPFLRDHVEPNAVAIQRLEAAKIPWQPASIWAQATKVCKEFIYNCMRAKFTSRWKADEALKFVLNKWIPIVLPSTTHRTEEDHIFVSHTTKMKNNNSSSSLLSSSTNKKPPHITTFPSTPTSIRTGPSPHNNKSTPIRLSPGGVFWDNDEIRSNATTHGGECDHDIANLHDLDHYSASPRSVSPQKNIEQLPLRRSRSATHLSLSPRTLHDSIQRFASYSDLKRAALLVAAHHVDHRRIAHLRSTFIELDTDNSGEVSVDELRAALIHIEDLKQSDIDNLFRRLDYDHAGVIHYHEFLAATIEDDLGLLDDEALRDAFDRLDCDDTGTITPDNLKHILGRAATDDLVAKMIQDGDLKRNGVIDFDEFVTLMRPSNNHSSASSRQHNISPRTTSLTSKLSTIADRHSFNEENDQVEGNLGVPLESDDEISTICKGRTTSRFYH